VGESHLARYALLLPAVEINSSFYRLHQESTYARWAAAVPEHFRFAVKLSRQITHVGQLADLAGLEDILMGPRALGSKLGPLLVQLPPSLAYEREIVTAFFATLREHFAGQVACEPRHQSWFTPEASELLTTFHVARVAADPAPSPHAAVPGGWNGLVYYRLHGSPQIYYSAYPEEFLDSLIRKLSAASHAVPVWCIFDNTASGAAIENALALLARLPDQ
jgi:uncharacterized protein YecE (DUF72 family)